MATVPTFDLKDEILSLKQGNHLCLLYEKDPAEQMPALVPFIQDAISKDEQFIYIADDQTIEALAACLAESGINVGKETDRGALKLWTRREWQPPGRLDSRKKSLQVQQFVDDAMRQGFKGSRFAVEMTWTLGPDITPKQLEHWEATINTIFVPSFKGRIVCQYNRSRLAPEAALAALHTHPIAILGEDVCPNVFYQAPLMLKWNGHARHHGNGRAGGNGNRESNAAARVEWMITQLKRSRAAEKERVELIQKRAALAEAELARQKIETILESITDGFIALDPNGQCTYVNRNITAFLGKQRSDLLGKNFWEEFPRLAASAFHQECEKAAATERAMTFEESIPDKGIWVETHVYPSREGLAIYFHDTTARKMAEEMLEEAVRQRTTTLRETVQELESFSYSISHDLRAPLRAMQGFAEMLLEDHAAALNTEGLGYLRRIESASKRLDLLIQEVLNYARVLRDQVPMKVVDLDRLVRELIASYPAWQLSKAAIEINGPLPPVWGHEGFLTQCISNLLTNAVKFVAPGVMPRVTIWAEGINDLVRIHIQDNGIGISAEDRHRIFRMFERINPASEYDGTGIGLTIVRKAAERMGGTVDFESELGKGSRFWIDLKQPQGTGNSDFKSQISDLKFSSLDPASSLP